MDRELKFRAWCEENKEMYYQDRDNTEGYIFSISHDGKLMFLPPEGANDLYLFYEWEITDENEKAFCKTIIGMEYVGLKDKNGKDIFEGDRFKSGTYPRREFTINFSDGSFGITRLTASRGIIIGNIYENPELLK